MAQQSVTLQPGESKVISFEATPYDARTYQVSVDGLTGSFKATAAEEGWVSPTGHSTSGSVGYPERAYDGDFTTFAILRPGTIVFTTDPTICSGLGFLFSGGGAVYIDIEYDGVWHNIFSASQYTTPNWSELVGHLNVVTFEPHTITAVRVQATASYPLIFYLYEIQLWKGTSLAKPATFAYVSDVRMGPWPEAKYSPNALIEVDIQNTSKIIGVCKATAYLDTSMGLLGVSLGTKVMNPGEVATFQGKWQPSGSFEEDDWWIQDSGYIKSEAGCISYKFGRSIYPVSFTPLQIASGSIITEKVVFHLAAGRKWYDSNISPTTGKPFGSTGDFFKVILPNKTFVVHALYPGVDVPDLGYISFGDMLLLPYESDYTFEFPLGPLSAGIYDIMATLQWSYQAAAFAPWHIRLLGSYKVGQVEII